MAASARSDVGRIVAQNIWSKSTPRTCAHPCTHKRALSVPLRLRLYTQIRRTMDRSSGTSERSISVQLPLLAWLAISARSAAPHPTLSSAMACFRVRGSGDAAEAATAHPVLRPHLGLSQRARNASSAAPRERKG
eukprot:6214696-Pleurochrysis_carterae.AAC.1